MRRRLLHFGFSRDSDAHKANKNHLALDRGLRSCAHSTDQKELPRNGALRGNRPLWPGLLRVHALRLLRADSQRRRRPRQNRASPTRLREISFPHRQARPRDPRRDRSLPAFPGTVSMATTTTATSFVVTFTPTPGTDGIKAVRALLKAALRRHGLRAVDVREPPAAV